MADLLKATRDYNALMEGFSAQEREMFTHLADKRPDLKVSITTPGTEAKLNGVNAADISSLVRDVPVGQSIPTKREIIEALGGNPKSSRDQSKVAKVLPQVPEIEIHPGQKAQMLRRLTGPTDDIDNDTGK